MLVKQLKNFKECVCTDCGDFLSTLSFGKVEFRLFQVSLLVIFVYDLWKFTKSHFE